MDWEQLKDVLTVIGGGGLIGLIEFLRRWHANSRKSKLLNPKAFDLPPVQERTVIYQPEVENLDHYLVGRNTEIGLLSRKIQGHPLVFVDGPSGVGKSTLLKLGVARQLMQTGAWLPVYVDIWGADWVEGPRQALADALQVAIEHGLDQETRAKLNLQGAVTTETMFETLERLRQVCGRRPALIFDQLGDYQNQHWTRFLHPEDRTIISANTLVEQNPFWSEVRRLCLARALHCVFAIRSDASRGLHAVRFQEPEVYPLSQLESGSVRQLISNLADEKAVSRPENGFEQLKARLADDLEEAGEDRGVLPIQMRVVISGLSDLDFLTPADLERAKGIHGLEAAHIEKHIGKAPDETSFVLEVLLQLVNQERGNVRKTVVKTLDELASGCEVSAQRVKPVIKSLEGDGLVRRRVDPGRGEVWQLYHDYLARGVIQLDRKDRKWEIRLAEAAKAFGRVIGPWAKWQALLRPRMQVRLAWERLRGEVRYGPYGRFAALSTMRLIVNLWLVLAVGAAYGSWVWFTQQEAARLFSTIGLEERISRDEVETLWEITQSSEAVRLSVIQAAIGSPANAKLFNLEITSRSGPPDSRSDRVVQAVVGVDGDVRRKVVEDVLRGSVFSPGCFPEVPENADRIRACRSLVRRLDTERAIAPDFLVAVMEKTTDSDRLRSLAKGLKTLGEELPVARAAPLAQRLVAVMEKTTDSDQLRSLAEGLGSLGGDLPAPQAAQGAQQLVAAMENATDTLQSLSLLSGLVSLGGKLPAAQAELFAQQLVAAMEDATDTRQLLSLASGLASLGEKLPAAQATQGAQQLVAAMEDATDTRRLLSLASGLASLGEKLPAAQATQGAQLLVAAMEKATDPLQFSSLASGLVSLGGDLPAAQAVQGVQRLVGAIEKTTAFFQLSRLTSSLVSLAEELPPTHAEPSAQRLLAAMEKTTDSRQLLSLTLVLGSLGKKLPAEQAGQAARRLVAVMEETTDSGQLGHLASGLGRLGDQLPAEQAAQGAQRLVAAMQKTTDPLQLSSLASALESLGEKLPAAQAETLAQRLVAVMEETTDPLQLSSLASALESLGEKLPAAQAETLAQRLVAVMEETTAPLQLSSLASALESLGEKLPAEQAEPLAQRLVAAIEKTTESGQLKYFASGLGSLGEKLTDAQAAKGAQRLVAVMEETTDSGQLGYLASGLGRLGDQLPAEQAAQGAERLVAAMEATTSKYQLTSLASGLGSLGENLPAAQAAQGVERLMAAMETTTSNLQLTSVESGLKSLGEKVPADQAAAYFAWLLPRINSLAEPPCSITGSFARDERGSIQQIIDVLKWPTCSFEDREKLIERIAELKGDPFGERDKDGNFRVDFWDFVDWAENEGYDMKTPPVPPESVVQ